MSSLKIITEPNPILRKKSTKITDITPEIQRLILDMAKTFKKTKGLGLSAPQIGQNIRLVLVSTEKGPLALINPKTLWKSFKKEIEEEGCLSIPETYGLVKRSKKIFVKAQNKKGKQVSFWAEGLFARVIQHEIDHLNGILIIDKFIKEK